VTARVAPSEVGAAEPRISVCVPTRNRGGRIAQTLNSLRCLSHDSFEAIIVDQSTDEVSALAFHDAVGDDPRFFFMRSGTTGKSVACNLAIAQARGSVLAFTDDDCVVPPDWLSGMERELARRPEVAVICGGLRAADHDPSDGYIPSFVPPRPRLHRSPWALVWCAGANLIVRTPAIRRVGGFDEVLGPGAPLRAGEDPDVVYRLLRAGYAVLELPEPAVVHFGLRAPGAETRHLLHGYARSWGAVWMKHLRLGDVAVLPSLFTSWFGVVHWTDVLRLRRPSGLGTFVAFAGGMVASFRHPIERSSRNYLAETSDDQSSRSREAREPAPG
jgi:glycosyltransferase involved in cell wall biosynthesis